MLASLLLTLLTSVCAADTTGTTQNLRNLEVTASQQQPIRATAPVQTMHRARLEHLGNIGVSDAIKHFSGVTVNDYGGMGGLKTVSVRAMGSKHTAVSYDGVPVTDAQSGDIDISRFRLDNVETLTLTTAGADAIFRPARFFGSGATLAITSRRPDTSRPFGLKASVAAGSFGYVSPSLRASWCPSGDYFITASADYLRADSRYPYTVANGDFPIKSHRKNSDIESVTGELNLNLRNVEIKGYYFDSDRGLPGSVVFYNDYASERLHDRNAFAQAVYKFSPARGLTIRAIGKFNYSLSRYTDRRPIYPDGVRLENNTQRELYGSLGALWRPSSALSATLVTDLSGSDLRSNYENSPLPERINWQTAAAASLTYPRWRATASMLATVINEHVVSGAAPAPVRRLSPALSASWRIIPGRDLHLRASVADGFRVPTFADRYYSHIGNVNLKPEKSLQTNLGITWTLGAIRWLPLFTVSVDGYFNRVTDKIVAVPTLYVWTMRNIGLSHIGGVDATLQADFTLPADVTLSVQGAYSWQHARDNTKGSLTKGHRLPYTAEHSGSATISASHGPITIAYSVTANGVRYSAFRNGPDSRMDAYADHSLNATYTLSLRRCTLQLRAEALNLTNVNYQVIRYYPMPGRRWQCSASITI